MQAPTVINCAVDFPIFGETAGQQIQSTKISLTWENHLYDMLSLSLSFLLPPHPLPFLASMCFRCLESLKRGLGLLELELQAVVGHSVWVLGT